MEKVKRRREKICNSQNAFFTLDPTFVNDDPLYVDQLHLCPSDFQHSFDLAASNRTLVLYEVEWRFSHQINILAILIESIGLPLIHVGNIAPSFNKLYSIQCVYQSQSSPADLRHINTHEFDRTVIIQCENAHIDRTQSTTLRLEFTELATKKVVHVDVRLCWNTHRRVTVGHCHKALFDNVSFHVIEQWLDYHLLIGIEQFYIYDRTLTYRSFLQPYVKRGQVVYVPFPLAKEVVDRERFNWIDQFVGKMHCLMHIRQAFDWLGTWDIDEYLNIYSAHQQEIFLPTCRAADKRCHSMLSVYLKTNFDEYNNIIIYAANYMGKRSLTTGSTSSTGPIIIEQFQHRSAKWNDRVKYITRPMDTEIINIHYALYISNNLTYESYLPSPGHVTQQNPRGLIRFNHYPSAQIERDDVFRVVDPANAEEIHDPLLWRVTSELHAQNVKRKPAILSGNTTALVT